MAIEDQHANDKGGTQSTGIRNLQNDEARFFLASIVDNLGDGVVAVNADGIITTWNKGAEELYGYTSGSAIGHSFSTIFTGGMEVMAQKISQIKNGQKADLYDTMLITNGARPVNINV